MAALLQQSAAGGLQHLGSPSRSGALSSPHSCQNPRSSVNGYKPRLHGLRHASCRLNAAGKHDYVHLVGGMRNKCASSLTFSRLGHVSRPISQSLKGAAGSICEKNPECHHYPLQQLNPKPWKATSWRSKRTVAVHPATATSPSSFAPAEDGLQQFVDEGETVEVRVPIPADLGEVGAGQVAVNTHQDSLLVTLATDAKLIPLLVASPLYGHVNAGDTIWYLDEGEIVVSLKKADKETPWPALVQALGSLARGVGGMLKSCSLHLVGECSEANWAVASQLALALGYVPMRTQQLVEAVTGKTVPELLAEEGPQGVAQAEATVLETLITNVRLLVATMGGPQGAAASQDGATWRPLHAGVTVWLACSPPPEDGLQEGDKSGAQKDEASPYSRADVRVYLGLPPDHWHADAAHPAAEGVLRAVKLLLEKDRELTGKKGLYLRLGCRGDWPEMMPPGWSPDAPEAPLPSAQALM